MRTQKRKNLDLTGIADKAICELGFGYRAGSESELNKKNFREELKRMLGSQLPGETYVYVVDHDKVREKYVISKYGKSKY